MIDPAVCGSGLDHGVLATDVIGGNWYINTCTHRRNNVEITQCWLDHDNVGALFDVGKHFAHRLTRIAPILLIALAVSATGDLHIYCVTEWAIQPRRVLGRVRHDRNVVKTCRVERMSNCANLSVHHAAWCNNVCACLCLRQRCLAINLKRLVVIYITVFVKYATMAVAGVFVYTQVGHQHHSIAYVFL